MTYSIVDIFETIQGEGYMAGTPAVFVRFAGCNMWTGLESHRERDAERHEADCPRWCDTDFIARGQMTVDGIVDGIRKVYRKQTLIVFTGGEPLLQLDAKLVDAVLANFHVTVAAETNGSVPRPHRALWLTLSPKQRPERIVLTDADELKVIYPAYDPSLYAHLASPRLRYIQPIATTHGVPSSFVWSKGRNETAMHAAQKYVRENPGWKLSIQTQKILGLP
jgi:organic radical activating enzyme